MVKKTILELPDGETTRIGTAKVAFEQDGVTSHGSVRPNPPRRYNILNQAQLEAAFGVNIEIPDGLNVTLEIDETFVLTKPIKVGDDSGVFIHGSTANTSIVYVGAGAMIQNTDFANPIRTVIFDTILIAGSGTNSLVDIIGGPGISTFFIETFSMTNFATLGNVEMAIIDIESSASIENGNGFVFRNPLSVVISKFITIQNTPLNDFTLASFIAPISTGYIALNNVRFVGSFTATGCALVYADPNSLATTSYIFNQLDKLLYDLYQTGSDITVNSVADNGSGKMRCTTAAPHGLVNRKVGALSTFAESTYNGTVAIDVISTTEFDTDIDFVIGQTTGGIFNAASLDSTNVIVTTDKSPGVPDSMFTGNAGLTLASAITVPIASQDTPVVINNANWSYNNLERFEEDLVTADEGRLITKDRSTRRYSVTSSATINRSGGGGINYGIILLKQVGGIGPLIIVSNNPPRVFTTTITPLTRTEIVELAPDDVIQLGVINYDGTADIDVHQANLEINKA